jgi:hypothetical protein
MLVGIILGLAMIIVMSIITEVRVIKERQAHAQLLKSFELKCEEHELLQAKHADMRDALEDLLTESGALVHDYHIVVGILESEIGEEEANRRYVEKKNETPKDFNDLMKEIKAKKGE